VLLNKEADRTLLHSPLDMIVTHSVLLLQHFVLHASLGFVCVYVVALEIYLAFPHPLTQITR